MTPLPKKKMSRARSNRRRNSQANKGSLPNLAACPSCGKLKFPHRECPHCGHYQK